MTTQEYEEIARRMRPRLMQLGRSFFDDEELAADVVQEALLRLWLLRERVVDATHAEALLVRLTKNVCVSEWRRRQRFCMRNVGHSSANGMDSVLAEDRQPMADNENQQALQLAIRTLTPQERQLFRMRNELGMDIGQIAAATGMMPRSVSHVVSVARHKIVEQLKKGGIL